jgi:glycosyltransferase involved in cell wall biosynthesis
MPLRVAILCEYPTLNGGERSMLACAEQLAQRDGQLTFLAPTHGPLADALQRRSFRHVAFDLHPDDGNVSRVEAVAQLVKSCRSDFDMLHANSLAMARLTGVAASDLCIPCTAHLRDIIRLSPAAIADLNRNSMLVAVSNAVRDFHVAQGLWADRTAVIYNGIDNAAFRPQRPTGWLRNEVGLPESAYLVACIGQVCLRKGQDVFARAAIQAADTLPDAHFLLIGSRHSTKPESVAYEIGIAATFKNAGLSDRFHPLGEREDVPELLGEIDILVHAARQEPFGRVLLEAAAAGVPIIATDVGGTREMLTDGAHALLVPADDPSAMADALLRLSRDAKLRMRLRNAARDRVTREFPIERSANELLRLWQGVRTAS